MMAVHPALRHAVGNLSCETVVMSIERTFRDNRRARCGGEEVGFANSPSSLRRRSTSAISSLRF